MTFEEYINMLRKYSIIEVNLTNDLNKNLENEKKMEKVELKTLIKTIKDLSSNVADVLKSEKSNEEKLNKIEIINEVIILLLKNTDV